MDFWKAWNAFFTGVETSENPVRAKKTWDKDPPGPGFLEFIETLPPPGERGTFAGRLTSYRAATPEPPAIAFQAPALNRSASHRPPTPPKTIAAPIASGGYPELEADHDKLIAAYCKNNPIERSRSMDAFRAVCSDHITALTIIGGAQRFAAARAGFVRTPGIARWLGERTWLQWAPVKASEGSKTVAAKMPGMSATMAYVSVLADDKERFEAMTLAEKWEYLHDTMGWERPTGKGLVESLDELPPLPC